MSVEGEASVGLVVDVRVRLENAFVNNGCGCRVRDGIDDEVGRRRTVVKALFVPLAVKIRLYE